MWQIIRDLVADGVTIFLTTQYLEEADQLADRIAVLDHGQAGRRGHARRAQAPRSPAGTSACSSPTRRRSRRRPRASAGSARDDDALTLQVPSDGGVRSLRALLDRLDAASIEVERFSVHTPDLDDVFLALTGRARRRKGESRA